MNDRKWLNPFKEIDTYIYNFIHLRAKLAIVLMMHVHSRNPMLSTPLHWVFLRNSKVFLTWGGEVRGQVKQKKPYISTIIVSLHHIICNIFICKLPALINYNLFVQGIIENYLCITVVTNFLLKHMSVVLVNFLTRSMKRLSGSTM